MWDRNVSMARIFDSFYVERPEAEARFEACYNLDRLLDERIANLWQFITILTVCQVASLIAIGWLVWQAKGIGT
jgi:hypothetical protein